MTVSKFIGSIMIMAVFVIIIAMTVSQEGLVEAAKGWLFSIGMTALTACGIYLIVKKK